MEKTIEIPEGYEAAIERCKQWVAGTSGLNPGASPKEVSEYIFPELAESEDEKTRKFLVELVSNDKYNDYGGLYEEREVSYDDALAYLERQKENPKNADSIPADCASSAKCENEHNKPGDFVFELRQIISRHRYADLYGECVDDEEGMAREIMALCERQKEQKPIQDGEEREYVRTLKSLIADFLRDKEDVNRGYYQDIYDWLDGRHIEQKLAEWSEEDEKNLKLAYDLLVNGVEADRRYPELISWLKSLRPHWKPSEEQMGWLESAARLSTDKPHIHGIIISLYEQLKRL